MFDNIRHWWKWNMHTPIWHFFGRKANTDWVNAYSYIAEKTLPYLYDFRKHRRYGTPIFSKENLSDEGRTQKWEDIINEIIFALEQCAYENDDDCMMPNPNYDPKQKELFKDTPRDEKGMRYLEFNPDYGKEILNGEAYNKKHERINAGLALFGQYFQNLWD
jgi:hypothetical protein